MVRFFNDNTENAFMLLVLPFYFVCVLQLNFENIFQYLTFALKKELEGLSVFGLNFFCLFKALCIIFIWPFLLLFCDSIPQSLLAWFFILFSKSTFSYCKKAKKPKFQKELSEIKKEKGILENLKNDFSSDGEKLQKEKKENTFFSFTPTFFATAVNGVVKETYTRVSFEKTVVFQIQGWERFLTPVLQSINSWEGNKVSQGLDGKNKATSTSSELVPTRQTQQSEVAVVPNVQIESLKRDSFFEGNYAILGQKPQNADVLSKDAVQGQTSDKTKVQNEYFYEFVFALKKFDERFKTNPIIDGTLPCFQEEGTTDLLETKREAASNILGEKKNQSLSSKKEKNGANYLLAPKAETASKVQKVEKTPSISLKKENQKKETFFQENQNLLKEEKSLLKNPDFSKKDLKTKKSQYERDFKKKKKALEKENALIIIKIIQFYLESDYDLSLARWKKAKNKKLFNQEQKLKRQQKSLEKVYNLLFSVCDKKMFELEQKEKKEKVL